MIERISGLPDDVIGVEASGKVTATDYASVLMPAIEARVAQNAKIRLLYVLGEAFDGYEVGAMWDDARLGLTHMGAWERIAVVTDHEMLRDAVKALGFMIPGESRAFPMAELDEAKTWIAA